MPKKVHDALAKVAAKYMKKGRLKGAGKNSSASAKKKAKNAFIYGTMANMKKRGEID